VSLNLDRSTWKRVKLGDVVLRSRAQADPFKGDVDRYVAGGHIDTDSVIISRSGDVADGQMGSTFRYLFRPGQVLFVSARPYLRKTGVTDFTGVVADKTYVLEVTPNNGLLQDMLPFLLTSDHFVEYATQEATGSMNPRLLWGAMQRYEFDLPPIDVQKRIADLMWAVENHRSSLDVEQSSLTRLGDQAFTDVLSRNDIPAVKLPKLLHEVTVGVVVRPTQYYTDDPSGVPALRGLNIKPGGFDLDDLVRFRQESAAQLAKSTLRLGDVVIVRTGRPGDAAAVTHETVGFNCIDLIIARPNNDLRPEFLSLFLNSSYGRAQIERLSAGTAQQHFNVGALRKLEIPALDLAEQEKVVALIEAVREPGRSVAIEQSALDAFRAAVYAELFRGG
jgi:type I restriction enzyme, S subunit